MSEEEVFEECENQNLNLDNNNIESESIQENENTVPPIPEVKIYNKNKFLIIFYYKLEDTRRN